MEHHDPRLRYTRKDRLADAARGTISDINHCIWCARSGIWPPAIIDYIELLKRLHRFQERAAEAGWTDPVLLPKAPIDPKSWSVG